MTQIRNIFVRSLRVNVIIFTIVLIWFFSVGIFNMGPYVLLLAMAIAMYGSIPAILLVLAISLIMTSLMTLFQKIPIKIMLIVFVGGLSISIILMIPAYHVINIYVGPKYTLWSLLTEKAKPSIGKVYLDQADDFKNGQARVREKGKGYLIDRTGAQVDTSKTRIIANNGTQLESSVKTDTGPAAIKPDDGFEIISKQKNISPGQFGLVDKSSGQVIAQYGKVEPFYEEVAIAYDRWKPGVINKRGRWVVEPGIYKEIEPFKYGMAKVRSGDSYGFIDTNGTLVIPAQYGNARDFNAKGTAPAQARGRHMWGLISKNGTWVLEPKYDEINGNGENYYVVQDAKKPLYGYCDWSGNEVIKPQFFQAKTFHEGLAAVSSGKEGWGYIDQNGNIIIQYQFYQANNFSEGLAAVQVDTRGSKLRQIFMTFFVPFFDIPEKWGYIDKNGVLAIASVRQHQNQEK